MGNSERVVHGKVVEGHTFYYDTSLAHDALSPEQWLWLLRRRWGVENDVHNILDVAFEEDDRLGICTDPDGTLALMVLRRIALNMASLFRRVAYRGEEPEPIPYKALFHWVLRALHALVFVDIEDDVDKTNLRPALT